MSFDITEDIPASLSGASATGASGDPSEWDVSFGAHGFNLRPSPQTPYQRGTEQVRKQQMDTSASAGEQSLSSFWQRSQDSWDMGAGVRWYEPGTQEETVNRFHESQGVDVWTPGQIGLLGSLTAAGAAAAGDVYVAGVTTGATVGFVSVSGSNLTWHRNGLTDTTALGGGSATQPSAAGGVAWCGRDGGVTKFDASVLSITNPWTCTGVARVWWVKARLIVAIGPALYECSASGAGVVETGGTLLYTHPDTAWTWTDVAETGGAILAAGYSDNDSGVFRFSLEQDENNVPTLSSGSQVVHMPPGEAIRCMGVYLGVYVVLGTSLGVRVGLASPQGEIEYGPLTVPLDSPALDVTFRDRFAYVAVTEALPDGSSGVVRIDLSAPQPGKDQGKFAWAWDVSAGATGEALSLCLVGEDVVLAAGRIIYEPSGDLVASGWLDTGRIRYGTAEPKAFRLARMIASLNGGRVALTALTPDGNEHRVVEFDPSYATDSDVAITLPGNALHQYLSFKVTLHVADDGSSPTVSGLVVKAVPAASRVRLYQFPLSVFDQEESRFGGRSGGTGSAFTRLSALEELEATGAPVQVRDNRVGESFTGQIDTIDFTSITPPDGPESGWGGTAIVVVRRL